MALSHDDIDDLWGPDGMDCLNDCDDPDCPNCGQSFEAERMEDGKGDALDGVFGELRALAARVGEVTLDELAMYREGGLDSQRREDLALLLKLRPDLRADLAALGDELATWTPPAEGGRHG